MTPLKFSHKLAIILLILYGMWRLSLIGLEVELAITEHMTLKIYLAPEDEPHHHPPDHPEH